MLSFSPMLVWPLKRLASYLRFCTAFLICIFAIVGPLRAASLEEMAGQMIMVGFQGSSASNAEVRALQAHVANGRVGGLMYLRNNVQSLAAVKKMNAAFGANAPVKPFIALDQEGGFIERLTKKVGFKEIPTAADVAKGMSVGAAETLYANLAARLAALGFNMNFGPVVDVNINPSNPIIAKYKRSYSKDPDVVARYGGAFVDGHRRSKVMTALKHFPGHGSSASDSHEGFVDVTKSWKARELAPYEQLISANKVDMVMVGHLYHGTYVGDVVGALPSSLSPGWITGVLRQELGFNGVVISDDMEMSAIRAHFGFEDAIVQAVNAGVDVLLFSNTAKYRAGLASEILAILVRQGHADPAFRARIVQSYKRIMTLKSRL